MRYRKIRVRVETDGALVVDAFVGRNLGLHPTTTFGGRTYPDRWSVTHLRTGFAIGYDLPRPLALRLLRDLDGLDVWCFRRKSGARYRAAAVATREALERLGITRLDTDTDTDTDTEDDE